MRHSIIYILILTFLSSSLFADSKHSVTDKGRWLLVTTYNVTSGSDGSHDPYPNLWLIDKAKIQSVDFADKDMIHSGKKDNEYVGAIVRLRITTNEIVASKNSSAFKQYVSGWMNIKDATILIDQIATHTQAKPEQTKK